MDNETSLLSLFNIDAYNLSPNFSIDDFLRVAVDYQDTGKWLQAGSELALVLVYCVVILCGLSGNFVVCFIICRNGNLKTSRNWYILNLSVCEMMTCVFCMPFFLIRLTLKNWKLGLTMCKIVPTMQTTYVVVSSLTIVVIAVDRYLVIVCSGVHANRRRKPMYVIPVIWVVSVSVSLPLLLTHRIEDVIGVSGYVIYSICIEHWESTELLMCYTVTLLVIHFLLPVLTIITLHILICRFLRLRTNARQASLRELNRAKRSMASHRKNMYLLTSIAVLFAVTWLPITLVNILVDFDQAVFQNMNFRLIHAICLLVAFCSVCINPVVYGWFNSNFRRDLHRWANTKVGVVRCLRLVHYGDLSTEPQDQELISMSARSAPQHSVAQGYHR